MDHITGPNPTGDSYGIDRSQFTGRQPDGLIAGESQETSTPQVGEGAFPNIQIEPTISDTLKQSYNNSFASIALPNAQIGQNNKQLLNQLSSVGPLTHNLIETLKESDPSKVALASEILAQNQEALEAAQQLYEQYYAPGAPHANQVQGYRFPAQQISNSFETMQHVAGLALVQTTASPSSSENPEASTFLNASETPQADPALKRGLNITEASFFAGKSFLSLLGASHLEGVKALPILRRLLTEMNVLHLHSVITQKNTKIVREINQGPRKVLKEKGEEKNLADRIVSNNILNNIVSNIGNRLSFLTKRSPVASGNAEAIKFQRGAQGVLPVTAASHSENHAVLEESFRASLEAEQMANQDAIIEENTAGNEMHTERNRNNSSQKSQQQKAPASNLSATRTSATNLSNQNFSYQITGNTAAAVDTNTAISMELGGPQVAAINTINISPTAMNDQLSKALQQSVSALSQLSKEIPQRAINASLL